MNSPQPTPTCWWNWIPILRSCSTSPAVWRRRGNIENDFLPAFLRYHTNDSRFGFWAVLERGSGEFLGWFHLRPGPGHSDDEPELGYRLRRACWGGGCATEGSIALIEKAFTDLGATRVLADTMVAHTASRRVMEKCGMTIVQTFRQESTYRIPGDEMGDVEYAITREQWAAVRNS